MTTPDHLETTLLRVINTLAWQAAQDSRLEISFRYYVHMSSDPSGPPHYYMERVYLNHTLHFWGVNLVQI
jgi:hypothetical protein